MTPLAVPVKQAAELLHCGRTRVFELLNTGALRRVRIGRATLVGVESISALLAPPEPEAPRKPHRPVSGYRPFTRDDLKRNRVLGVAEIDG